MTETEENKDAAKRRRKLRAALAIARRRATKACNKFQSVTDFYDDVKKNVGPIVSEFADVMPSGARSSLDRLLAAAEERSGDLETACKLCKGEYKEAIKDVSSRMGLEGQIRQALEPVENLAPEWLVASPVTQGVVAALGVVVLGGGVAAAAVAVATSGGGEAQPSSGAQPTDITITAFTGDLPDPCELVEATQAEGILGGPVVSEEISTDDFRQCFHRLATTGADDCNHVFFLVFKTEPWNLRPGVEPQEGIGEEAYWAQPPLASLMAKQDGLWYEAEVLSKSDCTNPSGDGLEQWRRQAEGLVVTALLKLGYGDVTAGS